MQGECTTLEEKRNKRNLKEINNFEDMSEDGKII
jgi:hypothetical protein